MGGRGWLLGVALALSGSLMLQACGGSDPAPPAPQAGNGDAALAQLATEILEDYYRRNPTVATNLGIHKYDTKIEDYSAAAIADDVRGLKAFRARLDAIDATTLSVGVALDRELLVHSLDSELLRKEVIRPWATDADSYSSGITSTAYVMIKRSFAPPEERLRLLIARLQAMPGVLAEARKNLTNPPRVYTEIAIEQADGNRQFFATAVAEAFTGITDKGLLAEFNEANAGVMAALASYKAWLESDLLKRSIGTFAYGADSFRRRRWADEMIDTSLEDLLAVAEADLRRNQTAFAEVARRIDPRKTPLQVLEGLQRDHPPAAKLLATTQGELDALAQFLTDKAIVTVPTAPPARVTETPPFLRATASASMDIPGPFETRATEAYYNMTLPDPAWPGRDQQAFMEQWYCPAITNVSVLEVWPGHYLQFLYAKQFPSDVRKVFGAASNSEGWAHYAEQMMLDEGLHADDPRYRLAQIQDALLRDVRFIVGIRMHTQGMTMAQAQEMFVKAGYQTVQTARSETKRGTSDATYGYYTMGKLMILKLREDYKAKAGP